MTFGAQDEKALRQATEDEKGLGLIIGQSLRYGFDLGQYSSAFLKRRIGMRMRVRGVGSYLDYSELLKRDGSEQEALRGIFSVNVTEFYRDKELFNTFRQSIVSELRNKVGRKGGSIRIWCAGCASGEEPYTVAILLREELGESIPFKVFATDRNASAIEKAKDGHYNIRALYKMPADLLQRYFVPCEAARDSPGMLVSKEVKDAVSFTVGDIGDGAGAPASPDVIFCRNVMIYMSDEMHDKMFRIFHALLGAGGYLVLGQSEMILGKSRSLFEPAFPKERIYRSAGSCSRASQSLA